jgi:hypothetical protein
MVSGACLFQEIVGIRHLPTVRGTWRKFQSLRAGSCRRTVPSDRFVCQYPAIRTSLTVCPELTRRRFRGCLARTARFR